MRDLGFIDVETTGLDPERHEIIEVAAARVDVQTLRIQRELEAKVRPEHIERAEPKALEVNGYTPEAWTHAVSLADALGHLTPVISGAILAGHNVRFDWSFLQASYRRLELTLPEVDYHLVDTASLAWPLVAAGLIDRPSLRPVCEQLGISNDGEHSAAADVRRAISVYRKLMPALSPATLERWCALGPDERSIIETIVERMHAGRTEYGPWHTADGRDYPHEALLEVMDALNYCAAELVRARRTR